MVDTLDQGRHFRSICVAASAKAANDTCLIFGWLVLARLPLADQASDNDLDTYDGPN